ncbi:MAG: peptidoglycan DD-metalloendopeptidase family protein [Syntrophales bacterium]
MGRLMAGMSLLRIISSLLRNRKCIGLLLIGWMVLSCSGPSLRGERARGIYHRVKSGETLYMIAKAYQVNLQDLAEINNIDNPAQIAVDSVIFIPDAHQVLDDVLTASRSPGGTGGTSTPGAAVAEPEAPPPAASRKESPKKTAAPVREGRGERSPAEAIAKDRAALSRAADRDMASRRVSEKGVGAEEEERAARKREDDGTVREVHPDKKRFIWPVPGKVVAKFGPESIMADYNGKKVETAKIMNNSIKIAAAAGTPVVAAAAGKVIYSMMLERFGNTIIIEHDDDFKTVYYDLGKRLVETPHQVKKGEAIATMGEGRDVKGESLMNFEIRQKNKPRDPLFFLP